MSTPKNSGPSTEAYWDKYGIPRVTLAEATHQFELSLKHGVLRGVHCWISEAGEGKTQTIHQLSRKYKYRVVDFRTSQFTLMSAGVPQRANPDTGMFDIAVPSDMPKPGERCILLFDEFNQGKEHAIAMCFRLLEDRGLYNYKLPDECVIVILMNPSNAAYNVTKIESNAAINRRLKKFYVYSTFGDWKKYAQTEEFHYTDGMNKACHPWVLKFLTTTPNMLYTAKDKDLNKQFACPATWQTVSLDLYLAEKENIALGSEEVENRIAASINTVNAKALCEYIRNNEIRISPDEILYNYKPKSDLRKRVLELRDRAGGDYTGVVETLAAFIFDEKLEPTAIAPQLLRFWADMQPEMAQAFYQMLGQAAEKAGGGREANIKYMMGLTSCMTADPIWIELNQKLISDHDDVEKVLLGKDNIPDPMT